MYLQRADKVNAGDEFEFEHHLVTVEEFKGTVFQDLSAIISPIVERRQVRLPLRLIEPPTDLGQHRQLQVTHQQHPLYPERGMRLQAPTQDSPVSAQQAMHPPALPRQTGGVGDAEHVSLTEILKRSAGEKCSSSTNIRTPVRRDASATPFRSGTTTIQMPRPDFREKEKDTPTRSVTTMRPPARAAQASITPVRPIQPSEGILDMPPPLRGAQSNITAVASRGTTSFRMRSSPFHHEISSREGAPGSLFENSNIPQSGSNSLLDSPTMPQAPNSMIVRNDVSQFQTRSSIGVVNSSKSASTPLPRPPQILRRTLFNPPKRSVPTEPPARGRLCSPSSQAALVEDGGILQLEEEVMVSRKRPTFTRPRTLAFDGTEDSTDIIMGDPPLLASDSDWLVPKGLKRVSEKPTTTIKLGTTKRKMLFCKSTIQRERSSEAGPTAGELTGFLEAGNSRQRSLADSTAMTRGAEDLLLSDTILAERRGNKAASIWAGTKISNEITGFSGNRPVMIGRDGGGGGHDGQETSEINTPVGVHGNSKSSVPGPPLGFFSSAYQASGVEHSVIVSDRAPGHKGKGKGKIEERTEKGSAHAIGANRVALDGCLDEGEGPGNSGGATSNTSGGSPTPPHPRRERKKREQIKETEAAKTEGGDTNPKSEFGPWSLEAFDLIAWKPPNLDG